MVILVTIYITDASVDRLIDLCTDTWFLRGVHRMALALSDHVPVYQYQLSFRDETSFSFCPGFNLEYGPTHGDELFFLLDMDIYMASSSSNYSTWSQHNRDTSLRLVKMWTNFAKRL